MDLSYLYISLSLCVCLSAVCGHSVDSLSYKEPLMKAIESEEDDGGGGGGGGRGRVGKRRGSEEMAGMARERKIEAMKVGCHGSQDMIFYLVEQCL